MRPIDADAYASDLWKLRENYQMLDDTHTADKIMHGLYRAEQALKEQPTILAPRWHRVEKEPKKEGRYLVWEVDGLAYCDTWEEGKWQIASVVPGTHITHWMSLPEPPKEETIGKKYDFDCDAQNNALLCVIAGFLAELCDHFCGEIPQEPPKEDA